MEADIVNFFINNGVAIAMLIYFISRGEKILIGLQRAVETNTETIKILAEKIKIEK